MTLALYGKSRKRQASLIGMSAAAILLGAIVALWVATAAFAHHLEKVEILPTCDNNGDYKFEARTGGWAGYREAVVTVTQGSTPQFQPPGNWDGGTGPFVYKGDNTAIISIMGNGAVSSSGNVKQYTGSFSDRLDTDETVNASETSIDVDSGDAQFGAWQVGDVAKFLNSDELVKVTAINGDLLTVIRGYGGTTAEAHSNNDMFRWVRGGLNGSPNTVSWSLQFDPDKCAKTTIIVRKVVVGGDADTPFMVDIDNHTNEPDLLNAELKASQEVVHTFAPDPPNDTEDTYTITEHLPPAGWALTGVRVFENSDHTCTGIDWDAADNNNRSVSPTLDHGQTHTVCFRNQYTAPESTIHVTKLVCDSEDLVPQGNTLVDVPVGAGTAAHYAAEDGCDYAPGWQFQYNNNGQGWNNFPALTDGNGHTQVKLDVANSNRVQVKEVEQPEYIRKGLYCHNDTGNAFDVEDWINGNPLENGKDYYCVQFNVPGPASVGLDKSQSGDGSYNVGEAFDFIITFKVSDGSTTAVNTATDNIPAAFDILSVAGPHQGGITCAQNGQQVTCDLPSGTAPGNYAANIKVAPNNTATCGEITNYATISGENADTGDNGDETVSINCASVVATKIVCPNESYFPDAADGSGNDGVGDPITANTAANFLTANEPCSEVSWTFEYGWNATNPGNNVGDSGMANFSGTLNNVPIQDGKTLWIREQKLDNYIDFHGVGTNTPQFSAEMYCSADVLNYDNWERIESTSGQSDVLPGETYYCVAFNTEARGEIHNVKIVTNVDGDTTEFTAAITGTENFTSSPFSEAGTGYSTDKASPGFYMATENEQPGYRHVDTYVGVWDGGPICERDREEVSVNTIVDLGYQLVAGGHLVFCHVNEAVGEVVLIKNETHQSAGPEDWDFLSAILSNPSLQTAANPQSELRSGQETFLNVPIGSYTISETQGSDICQSGDSSSDYQTQALAAIGSIPNPDPVADVIGNGNLQFEVKPGQKTYIVFENQGCGTVLSAANIIVRKWEDVDADFSGESLLSGWTITITGTGGAAAGFGPVSQDTIGGVANFPGVPDGTYTIQETPKVTHSVVGSVYTVGVAPADPTSGDNQAAGASRAGLSVALDETLKVDFFNQPKGKITVVKVETDNVGGGNFIWDFALDGCGIHKELSIVGSGSGSFQNLLPCANYLVTETNANSNGFFSTPIGGQGVNLGPGGEETVTFSNVRNPDSTPPPPTTTVTPPTDTPTVPTTPTDPTDTPVDPTDTPTPESTVAGEKTPGPGNLATPIAPDSGTGIAAGAGGASVLLALLGLAVLTAGAGLMALGRKRA